MKRRQEARLNGTSGKRSKRDYSSSSSSSDDNEKNEEDLKKLRKQTLVNRGEEFEFRTWNSERFRSLYANRYINKEGGSRTSTNQPKPGAILTGESQQVEEQRTKSKKKSSSNSKSSSSKSKKSEDKEKERKKLERAKKLQAMMDDAKSHEEKRIKRAKKSAQLEEKEEEQDRKNSFKGAQFMKDVKLNFNSAQTLEDRIRSRKGNQARTANDLEKNSYRR